MALLLRVQDAERCGAEVMWGKGNKEKGGGSQRGKLEMGVS